MPKKIFFTRKYKYAFKNFMKNSIAFLLASLAASSSLLFHKQEAKAKDISMKCTIKTEYIFLTTDKKYFSMRKVKGPKVTPRPGKRDFEPSYRLPSVAPTAVKKFKEKCKELGGKVR